MRSLFSAILASSLLFSVNASAKINSLQEHKDIFNKLLKVAGIPNYPVKLHHKKASSYVDGYAINMGAEDLNVICRGEKECIASVVAHEIKHVITKDYTREPKPSDELSADLYAVNLLAKAGYNPCAGVTSLSRVKQRFGDKSHPYYPSINTRIAAIKKECTKTSIVAIAAKTKSLAKA